jgi:simple sugar transport system ATP-binding protein
MTPDEKRTAAAPAADGREPFIKFDEVSKHYGAVRAVEKISLDVYEGEVLALLGDNGAGKSTLMSLAAGVQPPTSGTMSIAGEPVHLRSPKAAQEIGIETIFQDLAVCENLDAAANIFLGRETTRSRNPFSRLSRSKMAEQARETLKTLDIELPKMDAPVGDLSGGQRKAVAIARAVHWQARMVIMDEPTAALGVPEQRKVVELIHTLKASGLGVILVSHSMPEVFEVADRIVVLRRGQVVGDMRREEASVEQVVTLMVGGVIGPTGELPTTAGIGVAQ